MERKANDAPDHDSGDGERDDKLTQGVARFAQYTAPMMLAMLASGPKAIAASGPPPP
jgi:hypothetical protein